MNIQDFISSGILERYVHGNLSSQEIAEIEAMAASHPEIRHKIEELQRSHAAANQGTDSGKDMKDAPEQRIFSFTFSKEFTEYVAAISIGLAVVSAGASYIFYTNWQQAAQGQLPALTGQSVLAQHDHAVTHNLKKALEETQAALSTVLDTGTIQVPLKGYPVAPASKATIYWKKETNALYLFIHHLPKPQMSKQYQLWALHDGKHHDLGVFNHDQSLCKMKSIVAARAICDHS